MFTGIIQAKGSIHEVQSSEKGAVLIINADDLDLTDSNVGDSIAVNGVCLTVTALKRNSFTADASQETLGCTTFSELIKGQHVNLEKSLRLNQGIDGHLVSGHVYSQGFLTAFPFCFTQTQHTHFQHKKELFSLTKFT